MDGVSFYTQEHCTIYGHGVWHYLADLPIGHIHIIEYEGKGMEVVRTLIDGDNEKAEKLFKRICAKMLKGEML